jgi:hypothetical protein
MLKERVLLAVCVAATTLSCGLSSGDDDDDGAPTGTGGTSSVPQGGNGNPSGGVVSTGGGIALGGSVGTSGSGGGISLGGGTGTGKFDGGSVPITQEERDRIKGQSCAGFLTEPESLPSVLELVIDVSSSMNQRAPNPDTNVRASKWDVTRDALREAIPGVTGPGLSPTIAVGMLFYPNVKYEVSKTPLDVSACVNTAAMVPIAPLGPKGAPQRSLIDDRIASVQLQQSTPTHDAYRYALNSGLLPSTAPGRRFMLLITDGTPTLSLGCMNESGSLQDVDPTPIVEEITAAARENVKTFLIGSPGSEANRTWMSRAAVIGGTAAPGCNINGPNYCHLDMTTATDFSASLRSGLAKIVGQITPCTFSIAEPPDGQEIDDNNINVIITSGGQSNLIVRDDMGDCTDGWQLTADKQLLLCENTCNQLKLDASAQADVVFGCGALTEPIR